MHYSVLTNLYWQDKICCCLSLPPPQHIPPEVLASSLSLKSLNQYVCLAASNKEKHCPWIKLVNPGLARNFTS